MVGVKKTDCYASFRKGTKKGFELVIDILPTLMGLLMAVKVLRASGIMELLGKLCPNFWERLGLYSEILPLFLIKMVSSSAANGILFDIYKQYGTDSRTGITASLMLSSTETILYCMSVYFMITKVKKTRWTFAGALAATLAGAAASIILARVM